MVSTETRIRKRQYQMTQLLKVMVILAVLYTLYFAQSLFIPFVFSVLVALLINPVVTWCQKFCIPRSLSAFVLLSLLVTPFALLGVELAEPAEKWFKMIPKLTVQVEHQIKSISKEMEEQEAEARKELEGSKPETEKNRFSFFGLFEDEPEPEPPEQEESAVTERIEQGGAEILVTSLAAAPLLIAQMLGSIVLILFLLVYGPSLFMVFVRHFPIVENKRKIIVLVQKIQRSLSTYIVTISIVNSCLGLITAGGLYLAGVEDALLWGVVVGLLNFVPYVGSLISLSILTMAGLVQFGLELKALMPAGIFLFFNIIESQIVTPNVLGKSMRVNPLVVIVWLALMGWLWSFLGVLLAVPLLVCIKLVIDQIGIFEHWIKLIEADG